MSSFIFGYNTISTHASHNKKQILTPIENERKQFDYLLIMLNYYYGEIVNKLQNCNWKMTQFWKQKSSIEKRMSNFHSLNAYLKNDYRVPSHSTHNIKWSEIFMVEIKIVSGEFGVE